MSAATPSTQGTPGDDQKFFFVHLQKTAGTTLFRRLKTHFGAEAVYPMPRYQGDVAATLDVPLTVDVGIGGNWKDAKQ